VAGAVGFEPTNASSKSRCLTEMRVKNVGLLGLFFWNFKYRVRECGVCVLRNLTPTTIKTDKRNSK